MVNTVSFAPQATTKLLPWAAARLMLLPPAEQSTSQNKVTNEKFGSQTWHGSCL
jgi:hypothetical protein